MKKKPPHKQQRPEDLPDYDGSTPLDDVRAELFCEIYTTNTLRRYWAHGEHSYEFAYGYTDKLEKIDDEIDSLKKIKLLPKSKRKGKSLAQIDRLIEDQLGQAKKIRRVCASLASRLLTKASIRARCNNNLDNLATHIIVDRELTYLIQQRDNPQVKHAAISHYDKREQRIREKVDIKHEFEPVKRLTMKQPVAKK